MSNEDDSSLVFYDAWNGWGKRRAIKGVKTIWFSPFSIAVLVEILFTSLWTNDGKDIGLTSLKSAWMRHFADDYIISKCLVFMIPSLKIYIRCQNSCFATCVCQIV